MRALDYIKEENIMNMKLRDEFMINGPIHNKQLGYLLGAISDCNVKHFIQLSSDDYDRLDDPRISFNFDLSNNIYRYSLERITNSSPGVLTLKIFHGALEVYTITFWNIFLVDKIKITSSIELTNMNDQLDKLLREYDKDMRDIIPGLKDNLKKLIDEVEIEFINNLDTINNVPVYVLIRAYASEPEAVSTDKIKLERLRDAICKREDVDPDRFEILQYEEYDDSYVSNLPEDPIYLIMFDDNYRIRKNLVLNSRRDNVYASILNFDDEVKFVNEHGPQCDEFMDKYNEKFYCRAKSSNGAVVKYRKFIEERTIPNE